jgi:hypothetical protein
VQPPVTTATTTSSSVNPAAAAAAGAAVASSQDQSSESTTDWGWIAFGILAGAVLIFGIVWLVRRHGKGKEEPPPAVKLPT